MISECGHYHQRTCFGDQYLRHSYTIYFNEHKTRKVKLHNLLSLYREY
jgi:hypothetical protein